MALHVHMSCYWPMKMATCLVFRPPLAMSKGVSSLVHLGFKQTRSQTSFRTIVGSSSDAFCFAQDLEAQASHMDVSTSLK